MAACCACLGGDLLTKIEIARFARTLGTLLANGIPLLAALTIVKRPWATA
jgi:general secretion pathway protein F